MLPVSLFEHQAHARIHRVGCGCVWGEEGGEARVHSIWIVGPVLLFPIPLRLREAALTSTNNLCSEQNKKNNIQPCIPHEVQDEVTEFHN